MLFKITNGGVSFGADTVLERVDFEIRDREKIAIVGRNGAGKTTAMKAVLGLLKPDSGEIFVAGEPVRYGETVTNKYIGYLPDVPEFYPFMTPTEYLELCGECVGLSRSEIKTRAEELLALVGLSDDASRRIKGFSRGMKQRLGIAQALLHRPKLLICDEPTSALDPVGRREILDILLSVKRDTTVIFSTHVLSDVERICDGVALLEGGVIAMRDSVDRLKKMSGAREFAVEAMELNGADEIVARFPDCRREGSERLIFSGGDELMNEVMAFIVENDVSIAKIERLEPSLESIFMEVVAK